MLCWELLRFIGGSMRMTVSLCVIMVEITNNLKLLLLIMLVLLISKAVGDAFNEGLYEVISLPRVIRVADVASILRSNKHNGFPVSIAPPTQVIDHTRSGETLIIGLVLRRLIQDMLFLKFEANFSGRCIIKLQLSPMFEFSVWQRPLNTRTSK
ncbi:unnamed protein product [Arabis nemorensis]|uniref:Uncharacterized protein n=1 Tax=Arabis nemorensis TaxID=586526 RepID=A0A565AXA3_9BRAS|nr:unnamed protein product [Arabis nemorensis]